MSSEEAVSLSLHDLTARELRQRLDAGELSSRELTEAILQRIEQLEPTIGAFVTVTEEEALAAADAADKQLADAKSNGADVHPLLGIPVSVKDNLCTDGVRTTASSKLLADWIPPYDATVVRTLKAAGSPIVGKTNMDELAMGSTTQYSAIKKTVNPWDTSRVPGGSSGGAAASVAAGMAVWGLGTDTGGSIRQPAAYCGVVGMKPSYGRVSRFGSIALGPSLEQVGPMTKDVTDAAWALQAISGHDPLDATTIAGERPDFAKALRAEAKGLRIGLPAQYFDDGIDAEVRAAVEKAAEQLEAAGAQLQEISLPVSEYALNAYTVLVATEASSALARLDGVRYGLRADADDVTAMMTETRAQLGPEAKRRILLGTYLRGKDVYEDLYVQALKVRAMLREEFARTFEQVDVLLTPATPTIAVPLGDQTGNPVRDYRSDVCTVPINLAGLPSLSMPCAVAEEGLPIALQFIGPALGDEAVLQAAYTYEQLAWPEGAGRQWRKGKEVAVNVR